MLEEAYNERMHLLTFLKLAEPGWFMKVMILGAQGVFFNGFFLAYLLSPRTCHRFVGHLEEEAVYTYSRIIKEIEDGNLPKWSDPNFQIPDIAVSYWRMPEGKRTMCDLMLYVRADEAKHREVGCCDFEVIEKAANVIKGESHIRKSRTRGKCQLWYGGG